MHERVIGGLRFKAMPGYSCYSGSSAALLGAGLLMPEQLPGVNGNPATCASFHADGSRVRKGAPGAHLEPGYLKVQRMRGDSFLLKRCIAEIEVPIAQPKRGPKPAPRRFEHWPFPVVVGGIPS
ncbi:hypothetical protein LJR039_005467 [Pseudorhodoferax sp. LjRoot39]|uniref:hypothetical protein n=1 Tax=Pseudorhodoferax sp. LjRoot39 TaxID=3342328 RepID=UPI003ECEB962